MARTTVSSAPAVGASRRRPTKRRDETLQTTAQVGLEHDDQQHDGGHDEALEHPGGQGETGLAGEEVGRTQAHRRRESGLRPGVAEPREDGIEEQRHEGDVDHLAQRRLGNVKGIDGNGAWDKASVRRSDMRGAQSTAPRQFEVKECPIL